MEAESVWDYPRPPRVEPTPRRVRIVHADVTIVDTTRAVRVLETSHPPAYYLPLDEVAAGTVVPAGGRTTVCEWKGVASYLDVVVDGRREERAGWTYPNPLPGYEVLAGRAAFYAHALDECWVDDERVVAQDGVFYGGWITTDLVGPFKGAAGTLGW
jgi:uncharacterized protein (DUF427 family)